MAKAENPFRYFNSSPEVIRLTVLMVLSKQMHRGQIAPTLVQCSFRKTAQYLGFLKANFSADASKWRLVHLL